MQLGRVVMPSTPNSFPKLLRNSADAEIMNIMAHAVEQYGPDEAARKLEMSPFELAAFVGVTDRVRAAATRLRAELEDKGVVMRERGKAGRELGRIGRALTAAERLGLWLMVSQAVEREGFENFRARAGVSYKALRQRWLRKSFGWGCGKLLEQVAKLMRHGDVEELLDAAEDLGASEVERVRKVA